MPGLPVRSGREAVQVFEGFGWQVARQRGSHIILVEPDHAATWSVPEDREIAKGTLRSLVRAAGVTVAAFAAEAERH